MELTEAGYLKTANVSRIEHNVELGRQLPGNDFAMKGGILIRCPIVRGRGNSRT